MFRINFDVLTEILVDWIESEDFVVLDVAFCNHSVRPQFLALLQTNNFVLDSVDTEARRFYLHWLVQRKIKPKELDIGDELESGLVCETNYVEDILNEVMSLKRLTVHYSGNLVNILKKHGHKIKHLNIIDKNVFLSSDDKTLEEVLASVPNLLRFTVHLWERSYKDIPLETVHKHVPKLHSIDYTGSNKLTETKFDVLISLFQCLRTLTAPSVNDEQLIRIADNCPHLENIYIQHGKITKSSSMTYFANKCTRIKDFTLENNDFNITEGLTTLLQKCMNLNCLTFTKCKLNHDFLFAVGKHCRSLNSLCIDESCFSTTNTKNADEVIGSIAKGCASTLTFLCVSNLSMSDFGVLQLADHCVKLESLCIYNAVDVTDCSILYLLEKRPCLSTLDCFTCSVTSNLILTATRGFDRIYLNGDGAVGIQICAKRGKSPLISISTTDYEDRFRINNTILPMVYLSPNILELHLVDYSDLNLSVLSNMLKQCPLLQIIDLKSSCQDPHVLTVISGSCGPNLQAFTVSLIEGLMSKELNGLIEMHPQLESISLLYCGDLCDDNIYKIADGCCNIKNLDISCSENVSDDSVCAVVEKCTKLHTLVAHDCWKLSSRVLDTISETGSNLNTLELNSIPNEVLADFLLRKRHNLVHVRYGLSVNF